MSLTGRVCPVKVASVCRVRVSRRPDCSVPVEDVEEVVPGAGNQDTFVPLPRDVPVDQVRHLMIESRPTSALLLSQWGGGNLRKPHRHSHEVISSLYV